MCWGTKKRIKGIKRVALKDIHVKKIMYVDIEKNKIHSYFEYFTYQTGVLNARIKVSKHTGNIYRYVVDKGYHSYSSKLHMEYDCENELLNIFDKSGRFKITSYIDEKITFTDKLSVVDCIIPKGTWYFKNEKGEYVSENIIINKIDETF